jgi:rubrerythrin
MASEGQGAEDQGFEAFGRRYRSERAAIVSFIDKVRAAEKNGGEAFAAWAEVCRLEPIRTALRMIAEREAYHSRVFQLRLAELGGEERATTTEEGRKFRDVLAAPDLADEEKLIYFTNYVGKPEAAVRDIRDLAARIRDDVGTKEALKLFAEDELSTARWLWHQCSELPARRP